MSKKHRVPTRKTITHPFFNYGCQQKDTLFAVRAGVPFEVLLEQLQCFLKSTYQTIENAAIEHDGSADLWSAVYLVEISLALAEASVNALIQEKK